MKSTALFALVLAVTTSAAAAEAQSVDQWKSEVFTSKVSKVYSVRAGDHRFVAYVITWREQEVIAVPSSRSSQHDDFGTGEAVRCVLHAVPSFDGSVPRMQFTVLGSTSDRLPLPPEDEIARLNAIGAEVVRRRAEREAGKDKLLPDRKMPNKTVEPTAASGRGSP